MLEYDFMRTAFLAALLVALVCGPVGWFLVLRGQTFASHALSHVGFAGATGALMFGLSPLTGLAGGALGAGILMGLAGERVAGRDVMIGLVLSVAMGVGALFLHLLTRSASAATALLFGDILGISPGMLGWLAALSAGCLLGLAVLARPLLFATLQPEMAEARGVRLQVLDVLFLALVAIATAECAQITGVLLVFTLMVAPAATVLRLSLPPLGGLAAAAGLALAEAWGGLILSWETDYPTSFWIALLGGAGFMLVGLVQRARGA
ncbi:metal ABC transporter permease [Acetobacter farinalis]|uniref:Metal ABC transporter permease n=1 Tax=Acetobacter farinalis TaxID=1260984 RepID=A0ABT3Q935_9PROT|nr:metal ABC transporter permease [Acetobacter farinalis]MCX2561791.1 metal ABC transporter permease [Acetobacter farinalis]NHO30291.1 iron chelate uptake ABC transporter family permease subunit [Acetobacter farinalis]